MSASASAQGASLWSPLAHMPTVLGNRTVIVAGEGSHVTTADGRRLLDATSGLWHANVGHGRREIADAAAKQMATLETYQSFGFFSNDRALELADRLAALAPFPDAKVILTSGGSDSVEVAAKLARRHWVEEGRPEKRYILSRADSYHGLHAFGTSLTGPEMYREGYGPGDFVPETARFSSTDIGDLARLIEEIGPERIAAVITEPVIGSGGVIAPPPGYFEGMQSLAAEHDLLLIADEVITGFGRVGHWFGSERFGLRPDLLVFAKGVTSGYAALGGVLVAPRIWRRFYDGPDAPIYRHGVTYSGHATASAVAMANLDILERDGLLQRSSELEARLHAAVAPLASRDDIAEVRSGAGLLAAVAPVERIPNALVVAEALDRGVILRALRENFIQMSPPFVTTDDEIDEIVRVLVESIDAVAARG